MILWLYRKKEKTIYSCSHSTPEQAAKDGVWQRLSWLHLELTLDELIERSGLPDYVPVAVKELTIEGKSNTLTGATL